MTSRQEARAARRARPEPTTDAETLEARREAHRLLRVERGAHAARYSRGAPSAAVEPSEEFASVAAWRAFLEPLYPTWAVAIGVDLYDPDPRGFGTVMLFPDSPPRRRWVPASRTTDLGFFAAQGLLTPEGLWKDVEPGEPLPDAPPQSEPTRNPDDVRDRLQRATFDPTTATT